VLNHRHVQRRSRDEGLAHDIVVKNRLAVIAHGYGAGALERGEIGKLPTHAADGGCSDRKDIDVRATSWIEHPAGNLRRIIYRICVWHGADGSKSASSRSHGAAGNGLFVRLAGLTQMDVN